tara:strand:- start:18069 stop:20354 length:2286 start_codon:yes stop_codon:yes gene_type:complete
VTGTVKDGNSGELLVGARVEVMGGDLRTASDLNGEFELPLNQYPVWIKCSISGYMLDSIQVKKAQVIAFELFEQVLEIRTVVVSAGRRNQNIEDVSVSMEIITPELINNKGYSNLEQVVDQSPGVYAMDGQVSIRGGGGYAYGAGSRVLLLWNGIPMMSPDVGDAKWNSIPMEQTSQIEIMKGASSVLYGSGALNGVIALREKEPGPKGTLKAKIQSGIYDNPRRSSMKWWDKNPTFHLADLYFGKSKKNIGFTIGANAYIDSGYRKEENEERYRLNGSIYYKPKKYKNLKAGLSYNMQYQDIGVFVLWKNDSMGLEPQDNTIDRQRSIRISVDPYVKLYDKYKNKHYFRSRYYLVTTGNVKNVYASSLAEMYYFDYQFQRNLSAGNTLTAGFSNTNNRVVSWVFGDHLSENAAAYAQLESKFRKMDLSLGMRLECYKIDTLDFDSNIYFKYLNKEEILDSLAVPIYPIFRAGWHYELSPSSHIRASLGQGIRFPSVAERFVSTSVGGLIIFKNPNLKPEKGWAAEVGYKQILKMGDWKGYFDVSGFVNQYSNMVEFTFGVYNPDTIALSLNPEDLGYIINWVGFQAQNAERARIAGIEFSFNSTGKIGDVDLTSLLGYTYMDPVSLNQDSLYRQTFSDTSINLLKYRFRHLAKVDIQASYKKFFVGFSCRYNSYMQNIDRVFEQNLDPSGGELYILPGLAEYRAKYNKGNFIVDTRMGYKINDAMKINFIANNLLNAEYVTRPGDIQPPRSFVLQLQFQF